MFVDKDFNVNLLRNDVDMLLRRRHMSVIVCSRVSLGKSQII